MEPSREPLQVIILECGNGGGSSWRMLHGKVVLAIRRESVSAELLGLRVGACNMFSVSRAGLVQQLRAVLLSLDRGE